MIDPDHLEDAPLVTMPLTACTRSAGFTDIEPCAASEIPGAYEPYWVFMERGLDPATSA